MSTVEKDSRIVKFRFQPFSTSIAVASKIRGLASAWYMYRVDKKLTKSYPNGILPSLDQVDHGDPSQFSSENRHKISQSTRDDDDAESGRQVD